MENGIHSVHVRCLETKPHTINTMHLAGWLGSFPDAEVADEPGQTQTHGQLPAHSSHVLDTIWYLQDSASDRAKHSTAKLSLNRQSSACILYFGLKVGVKLGCQIFLSTDVDKIIEELNANGHFVIVCLAKSFFKV